MTQQDQHDGELTWEHATHDIPAIRPVAGARGRARRAGKRLPARSTSSPARALRTATPSCRRSTGAIASPGRLRAEISQACVVTLEPVDSTIEEGFDVTFWPEEDMPAPRGGEVDLDEEADPEPIVAGRSTSAGSSSSAWPPASIRSRESPTQPSIGARLRRRMAAPASRKAPLPSWQTSRPKSLKTPCELRALGRPRPAACRRAENMVVWRPQPAMVGRFSGGCGLGLVRPTALARLRTGEHGGHGSTTNHIARRHGWR